MRINIKPSDCKFVVDKEKKKVVCILDETRDRLYEYLDDNRNYLSFLATIADRKKVIRMPDRFVGIATCSPDDEWDETLGRKIAFYKMRNKFYHSLFKRADNFVNWIDDNLNQMVEELNGWGDKVRENLYREKEHLETRLKK